MKIDLCAFGRMSKREKKHFVHKLSEWERVQLLQAIAAANARRAYTPVEDRNIFAECKVARQGKQRVRNNVFAERCGRVPSQIVVRRFSNSRLTCVCKSKVL